MKPLCKTVKRFMLTVGLGALLTPAVLAEENSGKVTFEPYGIVMHPFTNLSKNDEAKLNKILSNYDERLYRLETYEKGKLVRTQGKRKNKELGDVFVDAQTQTEIQQAKTSGKSDSTVVFSSGDKRSHKNHYEKEGAFIEELKPLLKKYKK